MTVHADNLFEDSLQAIDSVERVHKRCIELIKTLGVVTNIGNIMVADMELYGVYKEGGFLIMDGSYKEDIYRNCDLGVDYLYKALQLFAESAKFCSVLLKEETIAGENNTTDGRSEGSDSSGNDSGQQPEAIEPA